MEQCQPVCNEHEHRNNGIDESKAAIPIASCDRPFFHFLYSTCSAMLACCTALIYCPSQVKDSWELSKTLVAGGFRTRLTPNRRTLTPIEAKMTWRAIETGATLHRAPQRAASSPIYLHTQVPTVAVSGVSKKAPFSGVEASPRWLGRIIMQARELPEAQYYQSRLARRRQGARATMIGLSYTTARLSRVHLPFSAAPALWSGARREQAHSGCIPGEERAVRYSKSQT